MQRTAPLVATLALAAGLLAAYGASHQAKAAGSASCHRAGSQALCADQNKVYKSDTLSDLQTNAVVGCRAGFVREGLTMCTTGARGPNSWANAALDCRDLSSNIADYVAWRYRIFRGDGVQAPVGWWLGPITADDTALFVNGSDIGNFDGETSRFDSRFYACAYFTK